MKSTQGLWRQNPSRPLLMGVINVTPDSFSDGGKISIQKWPQIVGGE